jgi:hypothetical protein
MTPIATAAALPGPASALFAQDEPVLQSHCLLPGIAVPAFGHRGRWKYHAHERPENIAPSMWQSTFPQDLTWGLRIRELLMVMLNPEHPAVLACAARLATRRPCKVSYAIKLGWVAGQVAGWALENAVPSDLRLWDTTLAQAYIEQCRERVAPGTLVGHVEVVRKLHEFGPFLTGGGLATDPWPGQSARAVARVSQSPVTTKNVEPDRWFAMVRAAWTYIHDFAPDILAAREHYRALQQAAAATSAGFEQGLAKFLADPDSRVPVHTADHSGSHPVKAGSVNEDVLWLMLGHSPGAVKPSMPQARRIRETLERVVAAGRVQVGGLGGPYAEVARPDGDRGPWHPGIGPAELAVELVQVRNASYCLVAALSMMRDSEIRAITRGSVVEHCGSPAVLSRKRKADPDVPQLRWWIADPVAEAIAVAEAFSWHEELIYTGSVNGWSLVAAQGHSESTFSSRLAVQSFIRQVNRATTHTGLSIPPGRAAPQQFRKTMAMLTARRPGGEIAVGHQLKHVATRVLANRVTEGYWADDEDWAKILDEALTDVRIEKLADLYADHLAGKPIGYGPAAGKLASAFDAVAAEAEHLRSTGLARHGDTRVEHDLLRQARIPIRFGTLNHCTVDDRNPVGAKCLEGGLKLPPGHRGPVPDLCQPGKCTNSLIRPEHLPVRLAERGSLLTLLENPRLSLPQRGDLERQLCEVDEVIGMVDQ